MGNYPPNNYPPVNGLDYRSLIGSLIEPFKKEPHYGIYGLGLRAQLGSLSLEITGQDADPASKSSMLRLMDKILHDP